MGLPETSCPDENDFSDDKISGASLVPNDESLLLRKEKVTANIHSSDATFQKVEFLIRDWQNFENEEDIAACELEMVKYLENVFSERSYSDLRNTREQIYSCFNSVTCYMMTHPGFSVTKKKYTGDVKLIDPTFLVFLDRYCQRVFGANVIPKTILGREV